MAVEFYDSFSIYAAANGSTNPVVITANQVALLRRYNQISPGSTMQTTNVGSPPTGSGYVLRAETGEGFIKTLPHRNRWIVGMRMSVGPLLSQMGLSFYQSSNLLTNGAISVNLVKAVINTDGTISLFAETTLIATSTFTISAGTYYYFEIVSFFDSTNPLNIEVTAQCYVNSVLVVGGAAFTGRSVATILSGDATTNVHAFTSPALSPGGFGLMGDFYIENTIGPDNVSPLGPVLVGAIHPRSDQDTQWTPSAAGTHFSLVNENPEDADTTYVDTATTTKVDTYFYDTVSSSAIIPAVQVSTCCRKTDEGVRTIEAVVGVGGGEAQSDPIYLAGNYNWYISIFQRDPNTNMPWTVAGVNATPFGEELAS